MLTREFLESGAYLATFQKTAGLPLWTRAQIADSLHATLAQRPDPEAPVWVFAYGSLIWNPAIHVAEQQRATLQGWRRSFCMRLIDGRARSDRPGRMLALDACTPHTNTGTSSDSTSPAPGVTTAPIGALPTGVPPAASSLSGTPVDSSPLHACSTRAPRVSELSDTPADNSTIRTTAARSRPVTISPSAEHWPTHTTGVALRIHEHELEHELMLVWIREMIGGSYQPRWQDVLLADGRIVQAITFTMDRDNPFFEPDASIATVAPLIANASGPLGHNLDYLLDLDRTLRQHHIHDPYVCDLIDAVRAFSADI